MHFLYRPQIVREGSGKAVVALELIALQPVLHETRIGIAGMVRNRQVRIARTPTPAVFAQPHGCLRPHAARAARLAGKPR